MKKAVNIVLFIVGLSLFYAIIRYNIVRNVSLDNLPLFIANKSIALSATILIGLSFLLGPLARFWPKQFIVHLYLRKYLGIAGFGLAALHAMMSLVLINPANYSKFYLQSGKFNLTGESSILFGILSFAIFTAVFISSLPPMEKYMHPSQWKLVQRFGYLAYFFVLLHVSIMGFQGWFKSESWQYGMASISLISALFILLVLFLRILTIALSSKKRNE